MPITASFPSFVTAYRIPIITIMVALIALFQGFRVVDRDYPAYFSMMMQDNISSIPPFRGYLLEGVLTDLIGVGFVWLGLSPHTAMILWWCAGLIALFVAVLVSIKNGSVSVVAVVLLVVFSRMVDTLLMWFPKFDAYLIAALILSVNNRRILSATGTALAALLHPWVAIVSTAGVTIIHLIFDRTFYPGAMIVAILMAGIDLYLVHYFLPSLTSHAAGLMGLGGDFASLIYFVKSGIHWGTVALVGSIIVPFCMIRYFGSLQQIPFSAYKLFLTAWIILVVVLSCFLTLDHTRVSCLLTVAPMVVFLRSLRWQDKQKPQPLILTFVILCLARLVIPHVYESGILLAEWREPAHVLWRWMGPLLFESGG